MVHFLADQTAPSGSRPRRRPALTVERLEDRLAPAGGLEAAPAMWLPGRNPLADSPAMTPAGASLVNDQWAPVSVTFNVAKIKQGSFQGQIAITNLGPDPISPWRLTFKFPGIIRMIWNARVADRTGNLWKVKNIGASKSIAPGATVTFGFNATPKNALAPRAFVFNGKPVRVPNPALPTLSIADRSVAEGDDGSTTAEFTVRLSAASTQPVSANYATADGSASAGSDYQAASGTVAFAPGETEKTIAVTVNPDSSQEGDETFFVRLNSPANANLGDGEGLGTIGNDDAATPGSFNYAEVLQKSLFFYGAQRSGDLPANYFIDWRGDSALNDGVSAGVDLSGGYYDAGDHVKFGLPMASAMTMLTWGLVQYRDAYAQSGQLASMLETVKWGTDWLMKAHTAPNEFWGQVGDGNLDHSFWGAPELMKMNRPAFKIDAAHPGSDLAGEAAAALAAASMAFRPTNVAYADQLLQHAIQLFQFADTYRGKYSDSIPAAASFYNSYSGYQDELVWGAIWLHRATGNQAYLDKAESYYQQNFAGDTLTCTQSWDDKAYGAAILLAQATGKQVYKTDVEKWLDYWTVGINGGSNRVPYTPGGLAHLDQWGSLRYAANTAFLALIYSDTVNDPNGRYHDFAVQQINYALGDNPINRSYVVGFGNNPPVNPHHRAASGVWDGNVDNPTPNRHILYGALVGGPKTANDNDYQDVRGDYIRNEVALDYNAGFQGAVARLFLEFGGQPLAGFPSPETRDGEFFVEANVNNSGNRFTEIRGLINNRSAWPARYSSALSYRYYVNLSEVYAAGFTTADVFVQSNFIQGGQLGTLQPFDAAQHIYYVTVDFTGTEIGPGTGNSFRKEGQFRIGVNANVPSTVWDPTNDWSYQGLLAGSANVRSTALIPVYEFGTNRLYGQLPAGNPSPGTPGLSVADMEVTEGNAGTAAATFSVSLSAASTQSVTVAYTTGNGTASAGSDFQSANGTLTFAPGERQKTITVQIVGDTTPESTEAFTVTLSNAVNATLTRGVGTATITDNDAPPASGSLAFNVTDNWGAGFVAELTVANPGATTLNNWTLEFDFDRQIASIWSAEVVSHVGNHYVIRPVSWNSSIAAGASVTFGFQGSPGTTGGASIAGPTNVVLTGTPGNPTPPPAPTPGGSSAIVLNQVDGTSPALQVTVSQGTSNITLSRSDNRTAAFQVATNNRSVIRPTIVNGTTLRLEAVASGRASVRIEDTATGEVRFVGIRVRTADGALPGMPDYLAVGSVSEDTTGDLAFWRDMDTDLTNKRMDIRYIYLNGGPFAGWRTWSSPDGARVSSYIRESLKLGMIPYFVWYNIPDGGESYFTDLQHIQDRTYMEAYFRDLKFTLDLIRAEAPDEPVGMLLEPDFIGYMMQNSGLQPNQIAAFASAAYSSGVLAPGTDPAFADTVQGLVQAINYTISKYAPNVQFGWQFNLWASPGITTSIPGTGLMHLTDTRGIAAGRAAIASEAAEIARYYIAAGILSHGADFVSIDKYGLDAGFQNGAAANPAGSTWFWNLDHWNNYLLFSRVLHEQTNLPVMLWQIPVGHINHSLAVDPYDGGLFPDLNNTFTKYEDSAPTFFIGDTFTATGDRFTYFTTNQGGDPELSVAGSTITWGSHMEEARTAGITAILFGAGVGESTDGVGSAPTDSYWWITQVQEYYLDPVLL